MNFKRTITVYRKELLEMFRDKRTIFSTILLPFILYPVIFIGFASLMSRQTVKLEEQGATVAIADSVHNDASTIIINELRKIEYFHFLPYSPATDSLYQLKEINGVVIIRDSLQASGIPVNLVSVKLDKSTDRGKMMIGKIRTALNNSETEILKQRLADRGISTEFISTIHVNERDTSTPQKKLGSILGSILPYLLIMLLIAGASVVASDLVAGEKERRTLETLMVSSAHRNEIVIGKYLTIITFALINVLVNLVSLYFSMRSIAGQSGLNMQGVSFPFHSFFILLAALIPLATLYAAVLLSISTFSRNMKEARSYEQPILIISMLLAMSSFFPAFELNAGLAIVPVINIALLFKAVMMGDYQVLHLLLTIGSTILLDIIAIFVTIRLFNNEAVLFRSESEPSLKYAKKKKAVFFSPYYGIIYFALALLALYYIGGHWQAKDIAKGLLQTQIIIILLPVLVILRLIKADRKTTLRLNPTKGVNFAIVPFISISAATLVILLSQIINLIYPIPSEYLKHMGELLKMPKLQIWQIFLLIAVLPGICEEIMFRGFILRFFEKQGKWASIFISALLFAFYHLDPYRFLPVFLLGILLAWLMLRSGSIYLSMFAHMINNALAVAVTQFEGSKFMKLNIIRGENLNWWVGVPAAAVLISSLYLFHKINQPKADDIPGEILETTEEES